MVSQRAGGAAAGGGVPHPWQLAEALDEGTDGAARGGHVRRVLGLHLEAGRSGAEWALATRGRRRCDCLACSVVQSSPLNQGCALISSMPLRPRRTSGSCRQAVAGGPGGGWWEGGTSRLAEGAGLLRPRRAPAAATRQSPGTRATGARCGPQATAACGARRGCGCECEGGAVAGAHKVAVRRRRRTGSTRPGRPRRMAGSRAGTRRG